MLLGFCVRIKVEVNVRFQVRDGIRKVRDGIRIIVSVTGYGYCNPLHAWLLRPI